MELLGTNNMMTEIKNSVAWLGNKVEENIPESKTEKENGRQNKGKLENQSRESNIWLTGIPERKIREKRGEKAVNYLIKEKFLRTEQNEHPVQQAQ